MPKGGCSRTPQQEERSLSSDMVEKQPGKKVSSRICTGSDPGVAHLPARAALLVPAQGAGVGPPLGPAWEELPWSGWLWTTAPASSEGCVCRLAAECFQHWVHGQKLVPV